MEVYKFLFLVSFFGDIYEYYGLRNIYFNSINIIYVRSVKCIDWIVYFIYIKLFKRFIIINLFIL